MRKILFCFLLLIVTNFSVNAQSDSLSVEELQQIQQEFNEIQKRYETIQSSINDLREKFDDYVDSYNEQRLQLSNQLSEQIAATQVNAGQIESLQNSSNVLINNVNALESQLNETRLNTEELANEISTTAEEVEVVSEQLSSDIEQTGLAAEERYTSLNQSLSQNTIYWVIAISLTFLLSVGLFMVIKRKAESADEQLFEKISSTKRELEKEGLKIDQKLIEVLNSQMKLLDTKGSDSSEKDHSLALKIADEVTRIRMNLNHMDPTTKGWKQLDRSARAIINNFKANGYEIPELVGKPYDENMNVIATTEIDEKLGPNEKIIKRIVKPQVLFNGKMIQPAQIVVAAGI